MFQNPSNPNPEDNGWKRNSANELEVQWFKDAFIPDGLHNIVCENICTRTDEDTSDEDECPDNDFLDDTSEDEEDIAPDDEDVV